MKKSAPACWTVALLACATVASAAPATNAPAAAVPAANGTAVAAPTGGAGAVPSAATTTATGLGTFFTDAETYFTTFSTNVWTGTRGYLETGVAYQQQVNVASQIEGGVRAATLGTNSALFVDAEIFNTGIAGTVLSLQAQAAWALQFKDVQIQIGAGAGDDFHTHKVILPVSLELQKKMTANSHGFLRLEEDILDTPKQPLVILGLGGSF